MPRSLGSTDPAVELMAWALEYDPENVEFQNGGGAATDVMILSHMMWITPQILNASTRAEVPKSCCVTIIETHLVVEGPGTLFYLLELLRRT